MTDRCFGYNFFYYNFKNLLIAVLLFGVDLSAKFTAASR